MAFISYDEFQKMDSYPNFIQKNPDVGYLKVQAFMADQAIPIANVDILITKEIAGNTIVFFRGKTNSSGIIDNIALPAPTDTYNALNETYSEYETYDLTAVKDTFQPLNKYKIAMFGGLKVLQYIKMIPVVTGGIHAR